LNHARFTLNRQQKRENEFYYSGLVYAD